MNNATVNRLILVLEIAAIILFHSLKSNSNQPQHSLAKTVKKGTAAIIQTSAPLVLHRGK